MTFLCFQSTKRFLEIFLKNFGLKLLLKEIKLVFNQKRYDIVSHLDKVITHFFDKIHGIWNRVQMAQSKVVLRKREVYEFNFYLLIRNTGYGTISAFIF